MSLSVTDIEERIDKTYIYEDVIDVSSEGIRFKNGEMIRCADSIERYRNSLETGIHGRKYVGDRNCLTEPPYMTFVVDENILVILFPQRNDFFVMQDRIRNAGFETFDLS